MGRGWMCVALAACWLAMSATAKAEPPPVKADNSAIDKTARDKSAKDKPATEPPNAGPAEAPMMMPFPGLPCPPPYPYPPEEPCLPPCEGPLDNGRINVPVYHIGFSYLHWYTKKSNLPPVVTSGGNFDTIPGALGQPNTVLLLGGPFAQENQHDGCKLSLGIGMDTSNTYSLMFSAFMLEQVSDNRRFASDGLPGSLVLSRPFFDVVSNNENADPIALTNVMSGSVSFKQFRRVYGGDADVRWEYLTTEISRLHFIGGLKLLMLEEGVGIGTRSLDLPGQGAPGGTLFLLSENFSAKNRFFGGQVGAEYELRLGPVFVETMGKVAFGVTDTTARLAASSRIIEPNGIVTVSNDRALYISPFNAGNYSRRHFAIAPEGALRLGIDFNEFVRFSVGYTGIYITDVARAADLVDRRVNVQPVGTLQNFTPATANAIIRTRDFWAQGLEVLVRLSF